MTLKLSRLRLSVFVSIKSSTIENLVLVFCPFPHGSFLSVAVITCASHAQGRRFEPGRKHNFFVVVEKRQNQVSLTHLM